MAEPEMEKWTAQEIADFHDARDEPSRLIGSFGLLAHEHTM